MGVDRTIWKILLDILVMVCVGFPILAMELWTQPYRRGFFADDQSIKLPFKEQSVPEIMGLAAGALMILAILLFEIFRDKRGKDNHRRHICGLKIPAWVWETYSGVGAFLFGLCCQLLFTDATKNVVGRLRPHFFDVCMPLYNATAAANVRGYIQDYSCARLDDSRLVDAHRSFPSGHTSFSMYCAVFFILYVQVKGKWRGSKLLRHGIQFAVLLAAWYVGLTRVQEHYHFWNDVAAGVIVGGVTAALVFTYVLKPKKYGGIISGALWDREPLPQNVLPRPVLARCMGQPTGDVAQPPMALRAKIEY